MSAWEIIKAVFKFIYVVIISFLEAITVSFYLNIKKKYKKESNEYVEVGVPKGYKDDKAGPEYKEVNPEGGFSDFMGFK